MNPQEKLFNTVAGPMGWIPPTVEIDWESRRWQAAVAAMQATVTADAIQRFDIDNHASTAVKIADILIAEFKKTEAKP